MSAPRDVLLALRQTIVGQDEVVESLVLTLVAGGHLLLEGVPGVAKTLACRALAAALGCASYSFSPPGPGSSARAAADVPSACDWRSRSWDRYS